MKWAKQKHIEYKTIKLTGKITHLTHLHELDFQPAKQN